ncbi:MAG: hypothetical protein WCD45_09860 [Gallionella sp.]
MKLLKSTSSSKLAALLVSATVMVFASQSASALTAAGTTISNTASLTYSIGGAPQTAIPSSPTGNTSGGAGQATTFLVDRKVDFLATGGATVGVQPGQLNSTTAPATATTAMKFTVANLGNGPQSFNLTPAAVAGDTFTPGSFLMYAVPAGSAFNPQTPGTAVTTISNLAAGASEDVYLVSTIPNPTPSLLNGNQALVTLSVQATVPTAFATATLLAGSPEVTTVVPAGGNATGGANVGLVDVVLAEAANSAVAAVATAIIGTPGVPSDPKNNGIQVAVGTYKIQSAAVIVAKVSSPVCDGVNGTTNPMNIPGSVIQWTVTLYNPTVDKNGIAVTTPATLTSLGDPLDASTAFDPNKVAGQPNTATTGILCSGTGSTNLATAAGGLGYTLGYQAGSVLPAVPATPTTAAPVGSLNPVPATTPGGTVTVDPTKILTLATPPATGATGPRVSAGDLLPGEYLTLYFNSIVQ